MFDFLKFNTTLKVLNIANNSLDKECGSVLESKLEENFTLISVDFSSNNFSLEDSRAIQDQATKNKEKLDGDRLQEWQERKAMHQEFMELRMLYLEQEAKR